MSSPRPVVWYYDRTMSLLFIGRSTNMPAAPWTAEIAATKVKWFDARPAADAFWARQIMEKAPKHNKQIRYHPPVHGSYPCPKCGNQKERQHAPYCRACTREYTRQRYLKKLAAPA